MSKNVDFSNTLSEDDAQYLRHRPWLVRDAELSGITIKWPGEADDESSQDEQTVSAEGSDDEEDEVDYHDLSVAALKAEIEARNEDREEDDQIEVSKGAKKDDLIAALEADDESDESEEDEEGETE